MTRKIATSATAIIFLAIGISGLMMYFHLFNMQVKALHENLGLVFIAAAVIHVIANWGSMKKYFSHKIFIGIFVASAIASAAFVVNSLDASDPKGLILRHVINAPMESAFEVLNISYEDALARLEASQIETDHAATISDIAKNNGTSPFRVTAIILRD